jgi:threonylcarbamoyladenosine tRNA methylthiotransferase MtaB
MPGFHIENFGCRAARADGEAIAAQLKTAACSDEDAALAEVVVVNTCSVTAEADREARAYIRRTNRRNPSARIVVTGCYAQRAPRELAALPGVAAVVGNSHKALAPEIALRLSGLHPSTTNRASKRTLAHPDPGFVSGHVFSRSAADEQRIWALAPAGPEASAIVPLRSLVSSAVAIYADDTFAHSFLEESQVVPGAQTRPNLKIQEGCSNRCTFCVIPQTRGNSRSLPFEEVVSQVHGFVAAGGNELVLSGINLGRWGRDLEHHDAPRTLAALVRAILDQTALPWLRLSSIEPMDWNDDLIALMRDFGGTRLCRHAHLPLQSGSDSVLRRMHRRYRPWHYAQKAKALIDAAGPELTLGADVMSGFPGETDAEFEETLAFVRAQPFAYLHLFPFSPRPGTRGWALHAADPVAAEVVRERMAALRALAAEKTRAHRAQFVGSTLHAVTLHTPPALAVRHTAALSENFLPVELDAVVPVNRMLSIRATGFTSSGALRAIPDPQIGSFPPVTTAPAEAFERALAH